jgi:8-oxo-dGTP pyrophosphatase MutT (NUDIX family)
MYKVFFNDRTIYLDDTLPEMSEVSRDYVCAFENITDLKPQVRQFLAPGRSGDLYIFHDDKDALLKTFSQCFKVIEASGGLVGNDQGELLLIFRRGKWDLPKGKAEKGETSEETAIREVEEEVGLKGIKIKRFLRSTYHIYMLEDQSILKKTEWYEMEYHGEDQPSPHTAEDITEVRWVKPGELDEIFANTYPSVKQVLSGSV